MQGVRQLGCGWRRAGRVARRVVRAPAAVAYRLAERSRTNRTNPPPPACIALDLPVSRLLPQVPSSPAASSASGSSASLAEDFLQAAVQAANNDLWGSL